MTRQSAYIASEKGKVGRLTIRGPITSLNDHLQVCLKDTKAIYSGVSYGFDIDATDQMNQAIRASKTKLGWYWSISAIGIGSERDANVASSTIRLWEKPVA